MQKNPELLAPAGSSEALIAALRCGADAVYVGATQFSARQSAKNFDLPALREAVQLCHLYGAKLYLTLNTLLFDDEYSDFISVAAGAAEAGADAFIMQDLGAVSLVRRMIPDLPVHASTQMSIHTPAGVEAARQLGITRVVGARELSRQQIAALCDTGMEIEIFCHGALCMSFSGQCYMSAMIGSRSANRGRCAQTCRLPFSAEGKGDYCALSLRDLCLIDHLSELRDLGVASLKIEGRMKRPEYVAAAVTAYRKALSGETPDYEQLRAVFSRSGFTDGYFTDERRKMFGVRMKEDVTAAKDALPALAALYAHPRKVSDVQMTLTLQEEVPAVLSLTDTDGNAVSVCGAVPQKALKAPLDEERAVRQLSKLGDTVYTLGSFSLCNDSGLMLPASALNALRRDAADALDAVRIQNNTPHYQTMAGDVPQRTRRSAKKPKIYVQIQRAEQLTALSPHDCAFAVVPIDVCRKTAFPSEQIIAALPRMITDESALFKKLEALKASGITHLLCDNLAHITLGKALGFTLHGGFGLNLANSGSFDTAAALGLTDAVASFELRLQKFRSCTAPMPVGLIAYGRLPLMLTRLCPIREELGCKRCTHSLQDRTGRTFPVRCSGDYVEVLNAEPLLLADQAEDLDRADFWVLQFEDESSAEISDMINAYQNGVSLSDRAYTRGLYYRGVQ